MRHHILLFALATVAEPSFGSEHLHNRGILPRGDHKSRPASPRTQASTPTILRSPQVSRLNSPLRQRPSSPARAEGILKGPGLMVLNTHHTQNPEHARIYPNARYMQTSGSPSAMVTTSSNDGSIASASGKHRVVASVRNGPSTESCINCVSSGGAQSVSLGPGSVADFSYNNAQPEKGPAGVTIQQFGSGAITALGFNRPEDSGT